jgi:MoaA/NifB/PqqE/SkfB family radical SAM enzyme
MSNGIEFSYASEETLKIVAVLELRSLDLLIEALKPRTEEDRYARRAVEDLEAVRKRALEQASTVLRLKLEHLDK